LTALIIGLITALWTIVLYNFIDPGIADVVMQAQTEGMEEAGMSDDDIERAMAMTSKFMTAPAMALMGLGIYAVLGFIASLIAGAVYKRERGMA